MIMRQGKTNTPMQQEGAGAADNAGVSRSTRDNRVNAPGAGHDRRKRPPSDEEMADNREVELDESGAGHQGADNYEHEDQQHFAPQDFTGPPIQK